MTHPQGAFFGSVPPRLASLLALGLGLALPAPAAAQIKEPGEHPRYGVELEPHLLVVWDNHYRWGWGSTGWGPGLRASIPLFDNGPIPSINNSMAIGFGLDWARYSHACGFDFIAKAPGSSYAYETCKANDFFVPVVLQWNFFVTKLFSAFGEPGLGIVHRRWSWPSSCRGPSGQMVPCDFNDSTTDLFGVFAVGGRLHASEAISFTFRLGWPYASVGASFFL
jgi:hypothetical protein